MTEDEKEQLRRLLLTFVLKWPSIGYVLMLSALYIHAGD